MKRLASLLLLALAGCAEIPDVTAANVLTIGCDAMGGACPAIADGKTQTRLSVCVPQQVEVRKSDLKATLRLPDGNRWLLPAPDPSKATQTDVLLSADRCAHPVLTASTTVGLLRVEATVDKTVITENIEVAPAPLDRLQIEPSTGTFKVGTDDILTVTPRAESGGNASLGTTLTFTVIDVQPPGEKAFVYPETAVLDGVSASTKLVTAGKCKQVTVRVKATPPASSSGDQGAPIEDEITLTDGQ